MDDWKNKVKTEAANGGLSSDDFYPDCTLFFHRDISPAYWVIVPHDVADPSLRLLYMQLLLRAASTVRKLEGKRPDAPTAIAMYQERAVAGADASASRCSGRRSDE